MSNTPIPKRQMVRRASWQKLFDFKNSPPTNTIQSYATEQLAEENIKNRKISEEEEKTYLSRFKHVLLTELHPIVNAETVDLHIKFKQLRQENWYAIVTLLDIVPCRTYKNKSLSKKDKNVPEEKDQKKDELEKFQIWRISEKIPNATGLLWIDKDFKLEAGQVIAVLNPTIMRRKLNPVEFDKPILKGNGLDAPDITLVEDTSQYPVGLYVRSEHTNSVLVIGESTHFGYCKHVDAKNDERELLIKLGRKLRPESLATCTQPINVERGALCQYHSTKRMDRLRSSRMELNTSSLFQNEDKETQYTKSVVFFLPHTDDVVTMFVDPLHNLKAMAAGNAPVKKKKQKKQPSEATMTHLLSNTNSRSAQVLLEQTKKNNVAAVEEIVKKQSKDLSREEVKQRVAVATSKLKALPQITSRVVNNKRVIDFDSSSEDEEENRPTKKRKINN